VTQVETKIERWIGSGWSAIPAGNFNTAQGISRITTNGGWKISPQQTTFNVTNAYGGWFRDNWPFGPTNVFRVSFKVNNSTCGWLAVSDYGYFRVSDCNRYARMSNTGVDEFEIGDISGETRNKTLSKIVFAPNPTTNTPASLSLFDINGKEVQQIFTNRLLQEAMLLSLIYPICRMVFIFIN
jgi:hypothetical protein